MKQNKSLRHWFLHYAGQLVFIAILFVVITIADQKKVFLTTGNLLNVMRQVTTNVFVACGMTLILIAGGIDLSIGAVMAISGMAAAYSFCIVRYGRAFRRSGSRFCKRFNRFSNRFAAVHCNIFNADNFTRDGLRYHRCRNVSYYK